MDEMGEPCLHCGGLNGVCFLTCRSLQLPANWKSMSPAQRYGGPE